MRTRLFFKNAFGFEVKILSTKYLQEGCFMPVAWAAEEAFSKVLRIPIVQQWCECEGKPNRIRRLFAAFKKASTLTRRKTATVHNKEDVMLFLMGFSKATLPLLRNPHFRKWIYLFDTWQPGWSSMESILKDCNSIECLYMSSSQAVEHFKPLMDHEVVWLPQAANSSEFHPNEITWTQKTKTILNIGRTNSVLDDFFIAFGRKHGFQYLRDEFPGEVKFKTREQFLSALYSAQIVLVHPRDLQYPEATGSVSMLTARNFEAYQSGGIVCGFKPSSGEYDQVLRDLPFVEFIDPLQFERELLINLETPEKWVAAAKTCEKQHTWEARAIQAIRNSNLGKYVVGV